MKTRTLLKRPFMNSEISQQSDTGLFSASDVVRIGNIERAERGINPFDLHQFLYLKGTKEFIEELEKENELVVVKGRGRSSQTWVHPLLFIDIALALNPRIKIQVYKWIFDELVKYRNDSGDSYRQMCGSLFANSTSKHDFHHYIIRVANHIKKSLKVEDWDTATQEQLKLRNKIHENITLLSGILRDNDQSVRLGTAKVLKLN